MLIPNPNLGKPNSPQRVLLGAGPQNCHPRVHAAMSLPLIGHMDPGFLQILGETSQLLKYVWQTENVFTIPISGAASAAWEALVANLTEPGDVHLIFVNGYFGERALDLHSRYKANIHCVRKDYGQVFTFDEISTAISLYKPTLVWICHAETSTGTLQPMEGVGAICRSNNCLLVLDTVTSICGSSISLDQWRVDAAYGGGQKCMGCPPGLSCLTMGERALNKLRTRKSVIPTWYLDLAMVSKYWDGSYAGGSGSVNRLYHHTPPISMIYAMREALQLVSEEGLENVHKRHELVAETLYERLAKEIPEIEFLVDEKDHRTPALTTIKVPPSISGQDVITYLREKYDIEIAGAFGSLQGLVLRIGLMGFNSNYRNVTLVVDALKEAFIRCRKAEYTV